MKQSNAADTLRHSPRRPSPPPSLLERSSSGSKKIGGVFIFPCKLKLDQSFMNIYQLVNKLRQELYRTKSLQLQSIFNIKYSPFHVCCTMLTLKCKFCTATIVAQKKVSGRFVVTHMNTRHQHKPQQATQRKAVESVRESASEIITLKDNKKDAKNQTKINTKISTKIKTNINIKVNTKVNTNENQIKNTEKQDKQHQIKQLVINSNQSNDVKKTIELEKLTSRKYLINYINRLSMEYIMDYENQNQNQTDEFPEWFVLVTPNMKENYLKYGDCVGIYIPNELPITVQGIEQHLKVWLFVVGDTNMRPLIVGIAILGVESQSSKRKVFESFIRLHKCTPKTFIVQFNEDLIKTTAQLNTIFRGVIILDAWSVSHSLRSMLKGTQGQIQRTMDRFEAMTKARNQDSFTKQLSKVTYLSPENQPIVEELLKIHGKKICFFLIPPTFISINTQLIERTDRLVRECLMKKSSVYQLLTKIAEVDKDLSQESKDRQPSLYREQIEQNFKDKEMGRLRQQIQSKVFDRFLENYFLALTNYEVRLLRQDPLTNTPIHIIEDKSHRIFQVCDWRCLCEEQVKTGVPCPHLLRAAIYSNHTYIDLFDRRWRVQPKAKPVPPFLVQKRTKDTTQQHKI